MNVPVTALGVGAGAELAPNKAWEGPEAGELGGEEEPVPRLPGSASQRLQGMCRQQACEEHAKADHGKDGPRHAPTQMP